MTDAHLIAAREWLVPRRDGDETEADWLLYCDMIADSVDSLAALLAEWERKGLERAAALLPAMLAEAECAADCPCRPDVKEYARRISALAQIPSTDKPEGKP